jgi:hypothetical protein
MRRRMRDSPDTAAFAEAAAAMLGLDLTPERRGPVLMHLKIAAEMAAKLDAVALDDEAEPAPVYVP